jgi:site-specific DNA-methyltransferase (adenine-specific)
MIYRKSHSIYPCKNRYWQVFEYMFVFSKNIAPTVTNLIKDRRNKNYGRQLTGEDRQVDGSFNKNRSGRAPVIGTFGVRHNVWDVEVGNNKTTKDKVAYKHPAIFPESLAKDHILSWSNPGDLVLDPMAGSGTVLKMSKLLGRNYCGIELSEEYIEDIIKPRLAATKIVKKLIL